MKKEQIEELFSQFERACYVYNGIECWSAWELQNILGYSKSDNFKNTLEKAKKSCENAGEPIADHFVEINKMVSLGSGSEREIRDIDRMVKKAMGKRKC